jgi:hypothetical protein
MKLGIKVVGEFSAGVSDKLQFVVTQRQAKEPLAKVTS